MSDPLVEGELRELGLRSPTAARIIRRKRSLQARGLGHTFTVDIGDLRAVEDEAIARTPAPAPKRSAQDERVRRYAARVVRRAMAFHQSEDGTGFYDPMMEAVVDLRMALAGRTPRRRIQRPQPSVDAVEAARSALLGGQD